MNDETEPSPLGRLGSFIRGQRKLADLSQRELARLANLSDPYVSQLERGLHEPSVKVLKALAAALNIRAETMLAYAGWLEHQSGTTSVRPETDVEAAVRADPDLGLEEQEAVLAVYRAFKDRRRA